MPFLSVKCFIGGTAIENDISNLENCTVAVGTPGRMLCLMKKGELATDDVNTLIFDESDALLSGTIRETTKYLSNLYYFQEFFILKVTIFFLNILFNTHTHT